MSNARLYTKLALAGVTFGGVVPYIFFKMLPTEEQVTAKYSPEIQAQAAEMRDKKAQEFDAYVTKLKEYSKSDKHIWIVMREEKRREQDEARARDLRLKREAREAEERMRREVRAAAEEES